MTGTVLKHRYEVLEKIGEGNLFTVYRCEDKIDNRTLAVKVLLPQYASNRMFAERMLIEAQAMVGVKHPGIVEVFDCGEQNGTYYVLVEYIRGVDLKERIRRNTPFTLTTAVDVGIAICDVLDFAHRKGFVHGDLRPGNILVTSEGQIKIADFWVSTAVTSASAIRTNAMMRSVHYMSPEVAEGRTATPAADIYSLGIILFELLAGTLPYDGDTPIAIALKHARDPVPSIRILNPGVPKTLEAVVARSIQKATEDRFRSAKSMLNELKSVHDALNLSKPLVWSQVDQKSPEPLPDEDMESDFVEEAAPAVLSAVKKVLIGVVVLVTVLVIIAAIMVWTRPGDVRVPSLLGKTLDQAQDMVAGDDIRLVIMSEQWNEDFEAGAIYLTDPSAGRSIKAGKTINVWISRGSRYAKSPDVANIPLENAVQRILDVGLNKGEVSQEYSETIPAGNVIKQTPSPGTRLDRGQSVSLVMSLGPKPTDIPLAESDTAEAAPTTRSFDVKFTVPQGPQDQSVQIIVQDDNGENTVYATVGHPGDRIEQTVQGTGSDVVIRIYIDDKLVDEERK